MSIHIVTHAYAETLPQYAVFLRAQLSSLVYHPPKTKVVITVCHTLTDTKVVEVMSDLKPHLGDRLRSLHLGKEKLFRRAIGRNEVALNCKEDILWATDVDHWFGEGCLDSLQDVWGSISYNTALMWPHYLMIQKTHAMGDSFCNHNRVSLQGGLSDHIDPRDFELRHNSKAIGGIQIIDGPYARKYGYLNEFPRWLKPVSPEKPFPDFKDDVKFRRHVLSEFLGTSLDIPNLFRLRHSKVTYKGNQDVEVA